MAKVRPTIIWEFECLSSVLAVFSLSPGKILGMIERPHLSLPPCALYLNNSGDIALTGLGFGSIIKSRTGLARWLPALMLLALTGCRQHEISPDAKFVGLYVELKLATVGFANDLDRANEVRRVILAQHQETPAGFHAQYVRLMAQPDAWRTFQESVVAQVEIFQNSHKKIQKDSITQAGITDSVKLNKVNKAAKGK